MLAHVFISFFAISLLILASSTAMLMGFQNYCLKSYPSLPLLRFLPALQTMEGLLFNILWCGMIFFSASLLSGFFFHVDLLHSHLLPKTILALSAWCLLTLLLIGRSLFGWRGLRAIKLTLIGTLFAFLSYFGTKIVIGI